MNFEELFSNLINEAKCGNSYAQKDLAELYINERKDYDQALYWLTLSAKSGNIESQLLLADIYLYNERFKDIEYGLYWLTLAAKKGNNNAQYELGHLYFIGDIIPQDYKKAIYWFNEVVKVNKHLNALYCLGLCYEFGLGVEADYYKAVEYYLSSISNIKSLYRLGLCYEIGKGVEQNLFNAYNHLYSAFKNGYPCEDDLNRVSGLISGTKYIKKNDVLIIYDIRDLIIKDQLQTKLERSKISSCGINESNNEVNAKSVVVILSINTLSSPDVEKYIDIIIDKINEQKLSSDMINILINGNRILLFEAINKLNNDHPIRQLLSMKSIKQYYVNEPLIKRLVKIIDSDRKYINDEYYLLKLNL